MATPASILSTVHKWYSVYAERRGGAPPAITAKDLEEGVARGLLVFHVPLKAGARAGEVVDGVRMLRRPVTAAVTLAQAITSESILQILKEADRAGGKAPADVDVVGVLPVLKQAVPVKLAEYAKKKGVQVRYLEHVRFATDIPNHAHVRATRHYIPDEKELTAFLSFTFCAPPRGAGICPLSRISSHDPQCVWLGARAGDIVAVHETTKHTQTVNYYQVVAARLGLSKLTKKGKR